MIVGGLMSVYNHLKWEAPLRTGAAFFMLLGLTYVPAYAPALLHLLVLAWLGRYRMPSHATAYHRMPPLRIIALPSIVFYWVCPDRRNYVLHIGGEVQCNDTWHAVLAQCMAWWPAWQAEEALIILTLTLTLIGRLRKHS